MGYDVSDSKVRVDRFKPRGKWYDSFSIDMEKYYKAPSIHDAIKEAILEQTHVRSLEEWTFVCLEPYHQHSHPIMIVGKSED